MNEFKLQSKRGRIASFSRSKATGVVVIGKSKIHFAVTSFRSGRIARYPKSGETVEALLSEDGRLVSVWAEE